MRKVSCKLVSSLEKVMLESKEFFEIKKGSCLKNERFSIQIALRAEVQEKIPLSFKIEC